MPAIVCPSCGEAERLSGSRRADHAVEITCLACATVWLRDAARRCNHCGSTDLEYAPRPLWAKGRGDQHTPAGRIDAYACRGCGGQDVTAAVPVVRAEPQRPMVSPPPGRGPSEVRSPGAARPAAGARADDLAARLLPLQELDRELDRLRRRAAAPPEQRQADASGAALGKAARALTAVSAELRALRSSPTAGSPATIAQIAEAQARLDAARGRGERLAADHRRNLAAVAEAQETVESLTAAAIRAREAAVAALDPSLLGVYEALRARVPDPVVPVVDIGTCAGCRIVIPPAELERAREAAVTGLARCPGCHRVLLLDRP